jgi:hypothetical protein
MPKFEELATIIDSQVSFESIRWKPVTAPFAGFYEQPKMDRI